MNTKTSALWVLILANVLVIAEFVLFGGSIAQVLWIYFLQSLIIGAVNVWRILSVPAHASSMLQKFLSAFFFAGHYGFFHLIYAIFLIVLTASNAPVTVNGVETSQDQIFSGTLHFGGLLIGTALFAFHHVMTFLSEKTAWRQNPTLAPQASTLMGRPYARIIPLHLIIIFGPFIALSFGSTAVFLVFIILKTIADIVLHNKAISHPKPAPPTPPVVS